MIATLSKALSTSVDSLPLGWQVVFILGVAALMLALVGTVIRPLRHWISNRTGTSSPSPVQDTLEPTAETSATDYGQRYADWMTAAFNKDWGDFQGCIKVDHEPHIEWHGLLGTDSHIEFRFSVSSSSVFTVKIVKYMDGHLKYQGDEPEKAPEITSSIKELKRSAYKDLKIRQWFSSSMMNRIALDGGQRITFGFSKMNILVEGKYPDGSDGPTCRLPLPDAVSRKMPTKAELEH